jgi:hypothetical protein
MINGMSAWNRLGRMHVFQAHRQAVGVQNERCDEFKSQVV